MSDYSFSKPVKNNMFALTPLVLTPLVRNQGMFMHAIRVLPIRAVHGWYMELWGGDGGGLADGGLEIDAVQYNKSILLELCLESFWSLSVNALNLVGSERGFECVRVFGKRAFGDTSGNPLRSDCVRSRRTLVRARSGTMYARPGAFGYHLSDFAIALSQPTARVVATRVVATRSQPASWPPSSPGCDKSRAGWLVPPWLRRAGLAGCSGPGCEEPGWRAAFGVVGLRSGCVRGAS